ncbi:uncharacterized protein LOC112466744 [Temnothorax curvispinosus]|uniref:Uncharacterized protein LOC112466744 n=1 Tax=Temnothorax curvispinosus TaxID=300111 RepID=A0A6J1R981_9HYME|nr:uncharacterized protein LOC112466744 [Temnothorax curvispinosus]
MYCHPDGHRCAEQVCLGDPAQENLQTDKGKEFYNADVRKILDGHKVNHYTTYSVMKASVVERFNRTLKNDMWKLFTLQGSYRWIDSLPRLLSNYNRRRHRTIRMRPADVTPTVAEKLLRTVYNRAKIAAPARFRIDDPVRTTEIFRIAKVQKTNPVTYLLKDVRGEATAGGFYEHELLRISNPDVYLVEKVLRKRDNRAYVKWLGMDSSHNSWIDKASIL